MTIQYLEYTGVNTDRGRSPAIWHDCPFDTLLQNNNKGHVLTDEFLNVHNDATAERLFTNSGVYDSFATAAGPTIVQSTQLGGGVLFDGLDADLDEAMIGDLGTTAKISNVAGENFKVWFEARIQLPLAIADQGLFIGLGPPSGAAANAVLATGTGALADIDAVGFHADTAAPTALDAIHQNNGGGGAVVVSAGVHTLVAAEFVKLGITYDPNPDVDSKLLYYWVNGVQVASLEVAALSLATFPTGENLGRLIAQSAGEVAEKNLLTDWWSLAMLRCPDG